jgi:hypothetical protein
MKDKNLYPQHYQDLNNALDEYVSVNTTLWNQQRGLNHTTQDQIQTLLNILNLHQKAIEELVKHNKAYKALLTEQEQRLNKIEKSLREQTVYMGFSYKDN